MSQNATEVVDTDGGQYVESAEHIPDATAVSGTLDTSGTAGADDSKIENISPVFDAAKAQDLQYAKEVVEGDVDDPGAVVNEGVTTTTTKSGRTVEEGEEAVVKAAEAFEKDPVVVEDPSIKNAEKNKKSGASTSKAKVEANQKANSGGRK